VSGIFALLEKLQPFYMYNCIIASGYLRNVEKILPSANSLAFKIHISLNAVVFTDSKQEHRYRYMKKQQRCTSVACQ